jgi:hypothetical protein
VQEHKADPRTSTFPRKDEAHAKHSSATAREPHVNQTTRTPGETIIDTIDFPQTPDAIKDDSSKDNIEALAEIICQAGDESPAALLVLMGALENSTDPKALAHTVKHFAFTGCGELNLFGIKKV